MPLPPDLRAALATVADRLDAAGVEWLVTGGVARSLGGFDSTPRDLDLETPEPHTRRAAAALGLTADWCADAHARSLRATGPVAGVDVDVSGGLEIRGPGGCLPADYPLMRLLARAARVDGRTVRVAPIEEQIARAVVAGDDARLDRIAADAPPGYAPDGYYVSLRLSAASARR